MTNDGKSISLTTEPATQQGLRARAERASTLTGGAEPLPGETPFPLDAQRLSHELHVHQIELEMQNDELRRRQLELESLAARYRDLYDNAPVGYVTVNPAGPIRQANFTAASMVGVPNGSLIGMQLSRFIHREDQDLYYLMRKRLADSGNAQACELRMLKNESVNFWVHLAAAAVTDPDGTSVMRLTLTDITERKQAELQIQQSEYRYRAIFANSHDAIFFGGPHGKIHAANVAACQMFGYTEEEFMKMGRQGLLDPADPALTLALEERERTGNYRGELTYIRKNGERFPADVASSVFPDADGTDCSSVIIRDISKRRRLEHAQAASLLEKGALLKEIHHRVKNNLQVISSLLHLERSRNASPQAKDVLDDMKHRIRAMALLHETLYRSEVFSDLDLTAYLKDLATQAFRVMVAPEQYIRLKLDLAPARIGLEQATPCGLLMNELISNCLKHAFPQGRSGEVSITLQAHGEPSTLTLCVSDNGVGLPDDVETRRKTSLGLQLVSDLANQLGGELQIGPGPGASFSVAFTPIALKWPKASE